MDRGRDVVVSQHKWITHLRMLCSETNEFWPGQPSLPNRWVWDCQNTNRHQRKMFYLIDIMTSWTPSWSKPYSCPSIMDLSTRTPGAFAGELLQKVDLSSLAVHQQSQWDHVTVEPVWTSASNATGASCPPVHYSHCHRANWLMWSCSCNQCGERNTNISQRDWWKQEEIAGAGWERSQRRLPIAQRWHLCLLLIRWLCAVHFTRPLWKADKMFWIRNLSDG